MQLPAYELKQITFPNCAAACSAVKEFGVCECESICPWKFDESGNAKERL